VAALGAPAEARRATRLTAGRCRHHATAGPFVLATKAGRKVITSAGAVA
jgi:hypothetical protein